MIYKAAESGSKFICLPEYFAFPASLEDNKKIEKISEDTHNPAVNLLKRVSKEVDAYIVGGTIFEKFRVEILGKDAKEEGQYCYRHQLDINIKHT